MILGDAAVIDTAIGIGDVPGLAAVLLGITAFVQWQMAILFAAYHREKEELAPDPQILKSLKVKLFACSAFEMVILFLLLSLVWYWQNGIVGGTADSFSVWWAQGLFVAVAAGVMLYLLMLLHKAYDARLSLVAFLVRLMLLALIAGLGWRAVLFVAGKFRGE